MIGKSNAITGGASFGHTVDFISDGLPYAKYIVTDGQSVAAPSPDPTKSGLHFDGWKDSDGNTITFPYTPTSDIQLTAQFISTREGMVLTEANKLICTLGGTEFRKINVGWSIAGYTHGAYGMSGPVLVGLFAGAVNINGYGSSGTLVYKGVTYYYSAGLGSYQRDSYYISTATDVTDLYLCSGNVDVAALTLVKRYLNEI